MKHFFVIIACIAAAGAITPGALAQEMPESPVNQTTNQTDTAAAECTEAIDRYTVVCSKEVRDGVAVIHLESERNQTITVTDAGVFRTGGEVQRKTVTLHEGRNTVRLPVTIVDTGIGGQMAGVSVETGLTLYAVPIDVSSPIIGGPWSAQDAQLSGLSAAVSVALVSLLIVAHHLIGKSGEPERVA